MRGKQRRLSDLYIRGTALSVNDTQGAEDQEPPVEVWLQKLNEIDRESVVRRANAARARYMIEADDEESDVFKAMYARIREFEDRAGLVAVVISPDVIRARQRIEAEHRNDEDTWGKDDYLQGLLDAWTGDGENPGLVAVLAEDPEDPEALRVQGELDRFDVEVNVEFQAEIERLEADWTDRTDQQLWHDATAVMLERTSDEAFGREYERQQLFHAVRDPAEHAKRYFATVAEIDDLDAGLRTYLLEQYNALLVEPTEVKDSRAGQDSSDSSASLEEIPEPSGLEAVSV